MRYFVTLDGKEFSLTIADAGTSDRARVGTFAEPAERDALALGRPSDDSVDVMFQTEILSPAARGRPALVTVDGQVFRVLSGPPAPSADKSPARASLATINGRVVRISIETEIERRARPIRDKLQARRASVVAPMPGRVVKVSVREGDVVEAGSPLLGIEAMKMENELVAPAAGRVTKVAVAVGTAVEADQELVVIEPL